MALSQKLLAGYRTMGATAESHLLVWAETLALQQSGAKGDEQNLLHWIA